MKPSVINHPLRDIKLSYFQKGALSPFETEAISRYQDLHTEALHILQGYEQIAKALPKLEKSMLTLEAEMETLEAHLKKYRHFAGYTEEELKDVPLEEYTLHSDVLERDANAFNDLVDMHWEHIETYRTLFNTTMAKETAMDDAFETFYEEYFSPIIQNWNAMEIDTVSFDKDLDHFRGVFKDIEALYTEVRDQWDTWVIENDHLQRAITTLYDRITKVFKHLGNMEVILSNPEGGFSEN